MCYPPEWREVLRFINHYGVQALLRVKSRRELLQEPWHLDVEVVLPGTVWNTRSSYVFVEFAREYRFR